MKILVVEDEQKLAEALKRGLELQGYSVDIVGDGAKALTRSNACIQDVGKVRE